jgi:hypothetical protein
MLQTMSEVDASVVFHRIRSGAKADAILRHIKDGSLILQISVVPPRLTRFEFPYIADIPSSILGSMYFRSHVFHAIQAVDRPVLASQPYLIAHQSNYAMPVFAAEMADPLLAQAKPLNWTRVSANDALLRKLLKAYFMFKYPWEYIF